VEALTVAAECVVTSTLTGVSAVNHDGIAVSGETSLSILRASVVRPDVAALFLRG
jgi:hypothetical protein